MMRWYFSQTIVKYREKYIEYRKLKAQGKKPYEITDKAYEMSVFTTLDAWVKDTTKEFKQAIRDYNKGNHNKKDYEEEEILAIELLYYLKKGEIPKWNGE
jgi:hypothetical protein